MYLLKVVLVLLSLNLIRTEECNSFATCGLCIGNSLRCVWCPDKIHPGTRCISREELGATPSTIPWCSAPYSPHTEKPTMPEAKTTSQLQPPHVLFKARPGDTVTFNVSYKPAKDYPIDIYYLFDNSWTMAAYKTNLTDQAAKIYNAFRNISNNVRFGAGSFVEKLALPFASETQNHKLNTFNNHLSLTEDIDKFVDIIKKVNHTSNLDNPEAGLDGLMQAMMCDEINWRSNARRIIIFSTDEMYHSAGDGKAVGAYKPNDMKCHLIPTPENPTTTHTYDKQASLLYDYPSVSQINTIASIKQISIFLTVTKKVLLGYQALEKAIHGAKCIELQVEDKSDSYLVKLIVEEYRSLTQILEIPPPEVPPHLQLTLDPDCKKNDSRCKITHGGTVNIVAKLQVKQCVSGKNLKDTLLIKPAGLDDTLIIDVEAICQCECEKHGEVNSTMCSVNGTSHGTLQCGVCKCYKGWYGKTCQCAGSSTENDDLRKCKINANDLPCSGKGNCSCGVCHCSSAYEGDQCQYRKDNCPTHGDKVCADNGICKNNKCECNTGWTDSDCSCSTNANPCVGANGKICSGNGDCKCSTCDCTNKRYTGNFCDLCDTCVEERCEQLKDYAICNYDGEKLGDKQTCDTKFEMKNVKVAIKNQTEIDDWTEGYYCKNIMENQVSIVYKYLDGNNSTLIWIQKEKLLPPETNIWIPIGSAIGAILLIGILTLIAWKVLIDIHDAREYRKFAKEAEESGFDVMENPLYKPAAVSINNPAYSERS